MAAQLKLYIFFFVLCSILFGCKTTLSLPPCEKRMEVQYPADLIRYFDFKPGSYWIFQDSITKNIDSIWLEIYEEKEDGSKYTYQKSCECQYDKCFKSKSWSYMNDTFKQNGANFQYKYLLSTSLNCLFYSNTDSRFYYVFGSRYIDFKQNPNDVNLSFRVDDSLVEVNDADSYDYDHIRIEPKLTLNNQNYENVLVLKSRLNAIYWVKDIGSVKIQLHNSLNKNLIRYHIVK